MAGRKPRRRRGSSTVSATRIGLGQNPESWEEWEWLSTFLASQLRNGRLALVIGAGASMGFGLPSWASLTAAIAAASGFGVDPSLSDEEIAERIWSEYCGKDDRAFAVLVQEQLYKNFSFDLSTLHVNSLLASLGALLLPSRQGSIRRAVSFNFDEVLEIYLRHLGFSVTAIATAPSWASQADVWVSHPHGLLPKSGPPLGMLVLTEMSFNRIVGDLRNAWYRELLEIFSSHTCLFIGLSGRDSNLLSLLVSAQKQHAAVIDGYPYWGVRFSKRGDSRRGAWMDRGVFQSDVNVYDEIPERLFRIRQLAAELT